MNNKKQRRTGLQRPAWVDNWLIRERVARWKATDRIKDWVRRIPRHVATPLDINNSLKNK